MKFTRVFLLIAFTTLIGCASEDPNIINPPSGSNKIVVRLLNMVPDNVDRKLSLDLGYQTEFVAPGKISDTVLAPSDSSYLEIIGDSTEFKTPARYRFNRQSIYDILAVGTPNAGVGGFDTIIVINANATLTTLPVAQLRFINTSPDTNTTFDLRVGCPNGESIGASPIAFRQSTLYRELPPGLNVFTLISITSGVPTIVNTYECQLSERTPYSVIVYQNKGSAEPEVFLYSEMDFTSNANREFTPVAIRDADLRVCNVGSQTVTVTLDATGQQIATDLTTQTVSAYSSVPTCDQQTADRITARFNDGRSATDSTFITVGGSYTIITSDSADEARIIIVPKQPVVYGAQGKSIIRVANASAVAGTVTVSVGARSTSTSTNSISSGLTLSEEIQFDMVSMPIPVEPGEIPLTITSAAPPTQIKFIGRTVFVPDRSYILVVADKPDGNVIIYALDVADQPGLLTSVENAVLARFVNGSPLTESAIVSLGTIVQGGSVAYRNSFATSLPIGSVPVSVGSASTTVQTVEGKRTLLVYAIRDNIGEQLIGINSDPMRQIAGISERRVINATADLAFVSVSYDTNFRAGKESEIVVREAPFGEASAVFSMDRDRRGTMFFYDSQTLKDIYSLPINFGPLGNNYSLIVTGRKEEGYEVIVLQEF